MLFQSPRNFTKHKCFVQFTNDVAFSFQYLISETKLSFCLMYMSHSSDVGLKSKCQTKDASPVSMVIAVSCDFKVNKLVYHLR